MITEIDGKVVNGMNATDIQKLILGVPGTSLTLKGRRNSGEEYVLTLTRGEHQTLGADGVADATGEAGVAVALVLREEVVALRGRVQVCVDMCRCWYVCMYVCVCVCVCDIQ